MALLSIEGIRGRSASITRRKSASVVINEAWRRKPSILAEYDIFLSHTFLDAERVLDLKVTLEEDFGHSVYIDWIDDAELDRTNVTPATADRLKTRMDNCKCLLFATTNNSTDSAWMPWELGYFDGRKGKAAILPLTRSKQTSDSFKGQEYLGLYPYVADGMANGTNHLWVHESPKKYVRFTSWLNDKKPVQHD